jgi:hypothetical protein
MKVIFGGKKNEELVSKRPSGIKQQRFCELCGAYVGAMAWKEWDLQGRMCKTCAEAYASSLEIELDAANQCWKIKSQFRQMSFDKERVGRFI